ncbi:MAG: DUF2330 domain-containing protein [Patescibacteria group bacterium]
MILSLTRSAIVTFLAVVFIVPLPLHACGYKAYTSPGKTVKVSELSQALIVWQGGTEHLVIDPGLSGDAADFGLVFAFPGKPEVSAAERAVFQELEDYTLPYKPPSSYSGFGEGDGAVFFGAGMPTAGAKPAVTVVEKKRVGDFQATVLTANDADALLAWFRKNRYQFTQDDRENIGYYIKQGGYYFVALKISVSGFSWFTRSKDFELRPVEFTFQTPQPIFPMRFARDDDPKSKFRIYAISGKPLIVPGAGLPFSGLLDAQYLRDEMPSLKSYLAQSVWLTKLDMWVDPLTIEHDLTLTEWKQPESLHVTEGNVPFFPEFEQRDVGAGITTGSVQFPARKITTKEFDVSELPWYEQLF